MCAGGKDPRLLSVCLARDVTGRSLHSILEQVTVFLLCDSSRCSTLIKEHVGWNVDRVNYMPKVFRRDS